MSVRSRLPESVKAPLRVVVHPVRRFAQSTALAGSQVECPCCNGRFRRFLDFNGRPNAQCPRCWSLERHRLLALYLDQRGYLEGPGPIRALHFAPELALASRFAKPWIAYTSADVAHGRAHEVMDLMALPLPDGSFDFVLCSHVLEHVPDDRRGIAELNRVLRPGGRALVLVPVRAGQARTLEDPSVTDAAERRRLFGQDDHLRVYGADVADLLREGGFEVEEFDPLRRFDGATLERHRLTKNDFWGSDQIYDCVR